MKDQPFLLIMRASHVIKGASSNLMCQELRDTSTDLEQAAAGANELDTASQEAEMEKVKESYAELKKAVDSYHSFLDSVDI